MKCLRCGKIVDIPCAREDGSFQCEDGVEE